METTFWVPLAIGLTASFWTVEMTAQLLPDHTLGSENSVVTPIDANRDRIDGGAARGANLFHSFQEFNVGNNHGVYFANPSSINNILMRVTGNNISEIFGTLGVLGDANLWLINPNGIHFGPNASLDIRGSFTATTADGVWLGTDAIFSATNPAGSQLLNIEPGALFVNQLANYRAQLRNETQLVTGADLTLDAANLELMGQLRSGGNLTLTATEILNIRDSVSEPFLAFAEGDLLVQGNGAIDILALNHSESGLFSGGDMVLRSRNPVGGDAHYFAGGTFRIEDLEGDLGALYSPNDPVIFANEDVSLLSYFGASLHIWAGGMVLIPDDILIFQPDTSINGGIQENVTLSNREVIAIDGTTRPTLDIRAGMDWNQVLGVDPGNLVFGSITPFFGDLDPATSSADIVLGGAVQVFDFANNTGGQVFLTNQYFPNTALGTAFGGISVSEIDVRDVYTGGDVVVDARSEINLNAGVDASAFRVVGNLFFGDGGDVALLSQGNTSLNSGTFIVTNGNASGAINITSNADIQANDATISGESYGSLGGQPIGKNITLNAHSISLENGSLVSSGTLGSANAGKVELNATDYVHLSGEDGQGFISIVDSLVFPNAQGDAGEVIINTARLELFDGALISSSTSGLGNAAQVSINATELILLQGNDSQGIGSAITSQVGPTAQGDAGGVTINTARLELFDGAAIDSGTLGVGNAAPVTVTAIDSILLQGENSQGARSQITSKVGATAQGDAGGITINTNRLELFDGALIDASTSGLGNAAPVTITATDSILLQGTNQQGSGSVIVSQVGSKAQGDAGGITVNTNRLELFDGAGIDSSTFGEGNAAPVAITATDVIFLQNSDGQGARSRIASQVGSGAQGDAGGVTVKTNHLELVDGAEIDSSTSGEGDAAQITITATDLIRLQGENSQGFSSRITSLVTAIAQGDAGGININTARLELVDGAGISSSTLGKGNAAQVGITATEAIRLQGENDQGFSSIISSGVTASAQGNAGGVTVNTARLDILEGGVIDSSTLGEGDAAQVTITATDSMLLHGKSSQGFRSQIISQVGLNAQGDAGGVTVNTAQLDISDEAFIDSSTLGVGNAGNINVFTSELIRLKNLAGISSVLGASSVGNPAIINLVTDRLEISTNSQIITSSFSHNRGRAGDINVNATAMTLKDNAGIVAETRSGLGGNLNFDISSYTLMRRNSLITTQAGFFGQPGDGGNITFNGGGFLVANFRENNDIIANAFGGRGGNITINSSGIYGLAFRDLQFPRDIITNDITASSDIGLNGVQTFNRLSFPAEQGLNELPDSLVDAEDILSHDFCAVRNGKIAGGTSLTVTGRGGIPFSPDEPSEADTDLTPWATRPESGGTAPVVIQDRDPDQPLNYRQAQGWQVDANGQIWLTAAAPTVNTVTPSVEHASCQDFSAAANPS